MKTTIINIAPLAGMLAMRGVAFAGQILAGDADCPSLPHPSAYTPMDEELFGDMPFGDLRKNVSQYMQKHSLNAEQMFAALAANIEANLTGEASLDPLAAPQTIPAFFFVDGMAEGLRRVAAYADMRHSERLRRSAIENYIFASRLGALPLASNVMTQAWRSYMECHTVWSGFTDQAQSAPPEERAKYVEFFKWAMDKNYIGGAIDDSLLELEPAWRSNALRRAALEKLLPFKTNETGTNNVLAAIRDYELAAGLSAPQPAPPQTSATQASTHPQSAPPQAPAQTASVSRADSAPLASAFYAPASPSAPASSPPPSPSSSASSSCVAVSGHCHGAGLWKWIAVGAGFVVVVIAGVWFVMWRRRRARKREG